MTTHKTEERPVITGMRVTEVEKQAIEHISEQMHLSQSAFMRYAIFSVIERFDNSGELR